MLPSQAAIRRAAGMTKNLPDPNAEAERGGDRDYTYTFAAERFSERRPHTPEGSTDHWAVSGVGAGVGWKIVNTFKLNIK